MHTAVGCICVRIPSKSDCLYPFKVKSQTLVNSAKCVLAIATFVPCVDVAVIGLLGSGSPAELSDKASGQTFTIHRVTI